MTPIQRYRDELTKHCKSQGMTYSNYVDYVDAHVHGDKLDFFILTRKEYDSYTI